MSACSTSERRMQRHIKVAVITLTALTQLSLTIIAVGVASFGLGVTWFVSN